MNKPSVSGILSKKARGYHSSGTIKRGRQIVARYYECDSIPLDCLEEVKKHYPEAFTGRAIRQYAPEIRRPCLIVPTQAEIKRQSRLSQA